MDLALRPATLKASDGGSTRSAAATRRPGGRGNRLEVHALRSIVSARDSTLSHKYTPCCVMLLSSGTTEKAATALRQASAEYAMQMSVGPLGQEAETPSRLCHAGTRRTISDFRPGPGPKAHESAIRSERASERVCRWCPATLPSSGDVYGT